MTKPSREILALAKAGDAEALSERWARGERYDLASVFDRAVTDFRTVKRNPGHLAILKFCVEHGMDLGVRADWLGQTALCSAARYGNVAFVEYVVERSGTPDDLFARAMLGEVELLHEGSRLAEVIDENGFNLLHCVAGSGLGRENAKAGEDLAQLCEGLLQQNVSPSLVVQNEVAVTPVLMCAWFGGNRKIIDCLLATKHVDVATLHQAVEFSLEPHQRSGAPFCEIADAILSHGFDINSVRADQGRMLLHGSAHRGSTGAVEWLLKRGADPHVLDSQQRTPLHLAAIRNVHANVALLLLDAGADRNSKDEQGKRAIDYAHEKGRLKVAAVL